jgi:putative aldouronate transport system permease protein
MPMVIKPTAGEKTFTVFVYIFLAFLGIVSLMPFLHVVARSLSAEFPILRGEVFFWPILPTFDAYEEMFKLKSLIQSFWNTVFIAVVGTVVQMAMTVLTAYPLSRKRLPYRSFFTIVVVFTMLFPPGIIPFYLTVRTLGLIDSYWSLIIPYGITTFNMIIVKNFFQSIPESLEDAALIDGANEIQILYRIFIPLSTPVLATITLFYMVGNWNVFLPAVFFINDANKWPIQVTLRGMLFQDLIQSMIGTSTNEELQRQAGAEGVKAATVMVSIIPILAVYPFIQRYFVKGIMLGSIKE